jgi:RNA polymerase sigma-70 factor (ECF subfamily)
MHSSDEPDDAALVALARQSPEYFSVLYRRHVGAVRALALRRGASAALADDITATVFERAWQHLERVHVDQVGLRPWLYRIAANELASHYRREGRKSRAVARLAGRRAEFPPSPEDTVVVGAELATVRAALGRLRPRHQEVLTLRYLAGLSAAETAGAMGVTVPVVAALSQRALAALERVMAASAGDDRDEA